MTFQIGDRIAHPLHGAGVIDQIEKRRINGVDREYYVLKLPAGGMVVMIPVEENSAIGVRPIIKADEAGRLLEAIPGIEVNMDQSWNRRYRENMLKIRSGNLMDVAQVVKGLMSRDMQRGLSNGERKMLHSAKQILISEIVLSADCDYDEAERRIDSAMLA